MKRITKRIWSVLITCSLVCSMILATPGELQSMGEVKAEGVSTGEFWYYGYTGGAQTFIAPVSGRYGVELWGSAGSSSKGNYARGIVELKKGDTLYLYVGGMGGFNGGAGGNGINYLNCFDEYFSDSSGNGGGGTDIRTVSNDANSRLISAGGGAGYGVHRCILTSDRGGHARTVESASGEVRSNGIKLNGSSGGQSTTKEWYGLGGGGGGGWYGGAGGDASGSYGGSGYNGTNGYAIQGININRNGKIETVGIEGASFNGIDGKQSMPTYSATTGSSFRWQDEKTLSTMTGNAGNGAAVITFIKASSIELKDVTTIDTMDATFKTFLADASNYTWYYHNGTEWQEIGNVSEENASAEIEKEGRKYQLSIGYDETYGENMAVLALKNTNKSTDDGLQLKCVAEGTEVFESQAQLKVLKNGYQEIMASYHKQLEAGTEIKIEDVLVALLYESGSPTFASGWSNLYFVEEDEEGNEQEVKTVRVEQGENVYRVRLKDMNPDPTDTTKETTFQVTGVDTIAPIMESVAVSPYSVRNEDASAEPEVITVTLDGSDNYTPADKLLYAIKLQGEEPSEGDFSSKQEYELSIPDNSVYVAYIKDLAGNITSQEVSILLRDADNPMIVSATLVFPAEDGWVNKNIIEVEATDNYMPEHLTYRFTPPAGVEFDQEDEENCFGIWITESRCIIESNGVYQIEVMDSVGNITSTEINVTNIDQNKPEIENIEIQAIS